MAKVIDVNERTLEKETEEFRLVCKVFEVFCIAIFSVIFIIAVAVIGIAVFIGAEMSDVLTFAVNNAVLLMGLASALNFGRSIFRKLKNGETPFRYDIADKVKGASIALCGSGFLGILVQSVSHLFSAAFSDICHYYLFIAIGNCIVGIILGIVSYVLSYGCKLQQESDETI